MPIELGEKLGVLVNQAGYRRRVFEKVTSSESKLQVDDTILYINEKYFS